MHNLQATVPQLSSNNPSFHVFSSLVQLGGKMSGKGQLEWRIGPITAERGKQLLIEAAVTGLIPGIQPSLTPPAQPAASPEGSKPQQ